VEIEASSDGATCDHFIYDNVPPGVAYPIVFYPDWSATNKIIFFASSCQGPPCDQEPLYAVNRDGTNLTQITTGSWASWSPDAFSIVFARCSDIYTANSNGIGDNLLTTGGYYPCWSPDASQIAFVRNGQIWIINADRSNEHPILENSNIWANDLDWGGLLPTSTRTSSWGDIKVMFR